MSDRIETVTTVTVGGVEYVLRRNTTGTPCKGCALNRMRCERHCPDGYVLQKVQVKKEEAE